MRNSYFQGQHENNWKVIEKLLLCIQPTYINIQIQYPFCSKNNKDNNKIKLLIKKPVLWSYQSWVALCYVFWLPSGRREPSRISVITGYWGTCLLAFHPDICFLSRLFASYVFSGIFCGCNDYEMFVFCKGKCKLSVPPWLQPSNKSIVARVFLLFSAPERFVLNLYQVEPWLLTWLQNHSLWNGSSGTNPDRRVTYKLSLLPCRMPPVVICSLDLQPVPLLPITLHIFLPGFKLHWMQWDCWMQSRPMSSLVGE